MELYDYIKISGSLDDSVLRIFEDRYLLQISLSDKNKSSKYEQFFIFTMNIYCKGLSQCVRNGR
jgi:hypothetical protein